MLVSAAGALWLASLSSSYAFTIVDTGNVSGGEPGGQTIYEVTGLVQGDAFNVDWSLSAADFPGVPTNEFPILSATGMVFVDVLTSTELEVSVMIDNTTLPQSNMGEDLSAPITVFGLSAPAFDQFTVDPGVFLDTATTPNPPFPGFNNIVNACVSNTTGCASGDPQTGIDIGDDDTFTMQFMGTFGSAVTLDAFALKWQTNFDDVFCAGSPDVEACKLEAPGSSFELAGTPSPKNGVPPEQIPEPHTLALLGIGLLGFGLRAARRAKH